MLDEIVYSRFECCCEKSWWEVYIIRFSNKNNTARVNWCNLLMLLVPGLCVGAPTNYLCCWPFCTWALAWNFLKVRMYTIWDGKVFWKPPFCTCFINNGLKLQKKMSKNNLHMLWLKFCLLWQYACSNLLAQHWNR